MIKTVTVREVVEQRYNLKLHFMNNVMPITINLITTEQCADMNEMHVKSYKTSKSAHLAKKKIISMFQLVHKIKL